MLLGFDPGRDKCGIAVIDSNSAHNSQVLNSAQNLKVQYRSVVASDQAISVVVGLVQKYLISEIIIGNQTTSKAWKNKLEAVFLNQDSPPSILPKNIKNSPKIIEIDERFSSAEARTRYWQIYPATGLMRLVPEGLRVPPCPVDDIVAIILIERYLLNLGKR